MTTAPKQTALAQTAQGCSALGPFPVGQTVNLHTRVTHAKGTTIGSGRTLTLTTA